MIYTIIILLQIIFSLILINTGVIFDLKKGIIPDKITLFLIIFGFVTNGLLSLITHNLKFILSSIISSAITYCICYLIWKLKIWGGGDVKLLTGISAVTPFAVEIPILNVYPQLSIYPFSFTVIINSILVSFPFLVMLIFYLNMKNKIFSKNEELAINLINYRNFLLFIKTHFNKIIPIPELKEGMIINNFYFNDNHILDLITENKGNLKVYKAPEEEGYNYYFKSATAGGLTEKDMYLLKIMYSQNIISKNISIKLGIPFAPFIAISYVIALFFGDLTIILIRNLFLVI